MILILQFLALGGFEEKTDLVFTDPHDFFDDLVREVADGDFLIIFPGHDVSLSEIDANQFSVSPQEQLLNIRFIRLSIQ